MNLNPYVWLFGSDYHPRWWPWMLGAVIIFLSRAAFIKLRGRKVR